VRRQEEETVTKRGTYLALGVMLLCALSAFAVAQKFTAQSPPSGDTGTITIMFDESSTRWEPNWEPDCDDCQFLLVYEWEERREAGFGICLTSNPMQCGTSYESVWHTGTRSFRSRADAIRFLEANQAKRLTALYKVERVPVSVEELEYEEQGPPPPPVKKTKKVYR
jgi:hypothetical protein